MNRFLGDLGSRRETTGAYAQPSHLVAAARMEFGNAVADADGIHAGGVTIRSVEQLNAVVAARRDATAPGIGLAASAGAEVQSNGAVVELGMFGQSLHLDDALVAELATGVAPPAEIA